jgi:hypothetical protein
LRWFSLTWRHVSHPLLSPLSGAHKSLSWGCLSSPSYPGHGCRPLSLSTLLSPVRLPGHPLRRRRLSSPAHSTTTAEWEGLLLGASGGAPPTSPLWGQWRAADRLCDDNHEGGGERPAPATREEESCALAPPTSALLLL